MDYKAIEWPFTHLKAVGMDVEHVLATISMLWTIALL